MSTHTVADVEEDIRLAIALALELPDYLGADGVTLIKAVDWADSETSQHMTEDVYARLVRRSVITIARDETRTEFVEGATVEDSYLTVLTGGHRAISMTVEVCSRSQASARHAVSEYGGKLRTRIWRDDVQALFTEGNVSVVTVHPSIDASWWNVGRKESKSTTDLELLTTEWDKTEDPTTGYIASIQGTGTFTGGATADKTAELEQDDETPP